VDTRAKQTTVARVGADFASLVKGRPLCAFVSVLLAIGELRAASYVYVAGGDTTGVCQNSTSTVWYAQVLPGGTLGAWISAAPLPTPVGEHFLVSAGNSLYAGAGCASSLFTIVSSVYYATVSTVGSISAWTSTTAQPNTYYQPSVVTDASGSFLYSTAGGCITDTWSAPISGGALGSWTSQTPHPTGPFEQSACQVGGSLFVLVQAIGGTCSASFWSAPVAGGVIGPWTTQPSPPQVYQAAQMVGCGSYIWVIGGTIPGQSSDVYVGTVSGGSVTSWSSVSPLPTPEAEHSAVIADGYIFSIAGWNPAPAVSSVYSAQILPGGALSSWTSVTALPSPRLELAAAAVCFDCQGTPVACNQCAPGTACPSDTVTRTATVTRSPTLTQPPTSTPTCVIALPNVAYPYMVTDRNVFDPERENLGVLWGVSAEVNAHVAIHNAAGEFVRDLSWSVCIGREVFLGAWDGRNFLGKTVASGVYVVVLRQRGPGYVPKPVLLRIAVLRGR